MFDSIASIIAKVVPQALGAETKVPAIPAITDANATMALRQVKHLLDVREGKAGDLMDANVTFRDLVKTGLVVKPVWSSPAYPVAPPYIAQDGYNPATDYTPPAAATNVVATGGIGTIILQWDTPGYRNHQYAEVWRSETNSLGSAVLLGTTDTRFYTDAIGSGVTRYYWVRFVSVANITGPYQGVDGVLGQTGQDPAYLISLLQDQLSSSELDAALRARIDLIDGSSSVSGSVNNRVSAEASSRAAAILAEQSARTQAIATESADRAAAILQESTARQTDIGLLNAALTSETSARITAVSAEASARDVLATQLRGGYLGTDPTQITTGLIYSERISRITAEQALQTQINTLSAASSGDFQELIAAVQEEQTARIAGDNASAATLSTLTARLNNVADSSGNPTSKSLEATLTDDRQSRVSGDAALSSSITSLTSTVTGNFNTLNAAIQTEASTRASAIASEATSRDTLATQMRGTYSGTDVSLLTSGLLYSERQARSTADSALSTSITGLSSTVTSNYNTLNAAIQTESTTRASAVNSLSTQVTTLQSTVTTNNSTLSAAIQSEASTRASIDGSLLAQYTIKTQVNGYVSGFGLASTSNNAAPTSEFAVLADSFKIASPTGPGITPATPFIVRTTATTIGGVAVPVGVYLQDAFIANGTINNAKIANAAIDNAKIANLDAAKITTGFISADRLDATTITAKVLEVAAAKVTGMLTANQINGADLVIRSGQYVGYAWPATGGGFYLGPSGLLMGRYSATDPTSTFFQFDVATKTVYTNGLTIQNGNATFTGNISVTSAAGGARMEINNSVIRVFDAAGVIRVKIGNLA